jgi:hypothetical protein
MDLNPRPNPGAGLANSLLKFFAMSARSGATSGISPEQYANECVDMLGAPAGPGVGPDCRAPPVNMVSFLDLHSVDDYVAWVLRLLLPTVYVSAWENGAGMLPNERNTLFHGTRVLHSFRCGDHPGCRAVAVMQS